MNEDNEFEIGLKFGLEAIDLGDAKVETMACSPLPMYVDNLYGYGSESGTYPPYCPYGG